MKIPMVPNSIKDCGFNALALIFFIVAIYLLLWRLPLRNATAALIAAAFCALMGNPDRFQMKISLLTGYGNESSPSDPTGGGEQVTGSKTRGDRQ